MRLPCLQAYTKDDVKVKEGGVLDGLLQLIESFPKPTGSSSSSAAPSAGGSSQGENDDKDCTQVEECSRLVLAAVKWANR